MIKGINHKVIEITDTQSIYYERAWLVVRPQYRGAEESLLKSEGIKLTMSAGAPSSFKGKRAFGYWFLRLGMAALISASLTLALCIVFFKIV